MTNQQRSQEIEKRLTQTFQPTHLMVYDDSDSHIGHLGSESGAGHFIVEITSSAFDGLSRLQCHRLIYQILDDMMTTEIHALSITALPIQKDGAAQ